jgi:hypothetical protein
VKYPFPLLNALQDGAHLDVRVKFAAQLLVAPNFVNDAALDLIKADDDGNADVASKARLVVGFALDVADELYGQAAARGWLEPLTDGSDVPPHEMAHVLRNASAQTFGQIHGQELAQAAQAASRQLLSVPNRSM